jgi:hypothetical protein
MIENTSNREPLEHLAGMLGGTDRYIGEMESAGQAQLVASTELPVRMNSGSENDVTALGIELGPVGPDPLFRPAKLPPGWKKQATDHAMWSRVVDEHGRPRLSIFYKAAFYDRDAFMSLETVYSYANHVINGAPLHLDDWVTGKALIEAIGQHCDQFEKYAARRDEDGYWASQIEACDRVVLRATEAMEAAS